VCRYGFSRDLADLVMRDLTQVTNTLRADVEKAGPGRPPHASASSERALVRSSVGAPING